MPASFVPAEELEHRLGGSLDPCAPPIVFRGSAPLVMMSRRQWLERNERGRRTILSQHVYPMVRNLGYEPVESLAGMIVALPEEEVFAVVQEAREDGPWREAGLAAFAALARDAQRVFRSWQRQARGPAADTLGVS